MTIDFAKVDEVHFLPGQIEESFLKAEEACAPLVIRGALHQWPALTTWNLKNGGAHLKALAGSAQVHAMSSTAEGGIFFGDVRSHAPMAITFADFLDDALEAQSTVEPDAAMPEMEDRSNQGSQFEEERRGVLQAGTKRETSRLQLYLAQAPLSSKEEKTLPDLAPLLQDVNTPGFLDASRVSEINLWMSINGSRSSTHYDPYQNLLCVVAGSKQVTMWDPSLTPALYPMAAYGEAANHSAVNFVNPDFEQHAKYKEALAKCWRAEVRAGDALFLPEGWWHQVDSAGTTIAVNFWWPSPFTVRLGTHMDAYYLRAVVASLVASEKKLALAAVQEQTQARMPMPQASARGTRDSTTEAESISEGAQQEMASGADLSIDQPGEWDDSRGSDKQQSSRSGKARRRRGHRRSSSGTHGKSCADITSSDPGHKAEACQEPVRVARAEVMGVLTETERNLVGVLVGAAANLPGVAPSGGAESGAEGDGNCCGQRGRLKGVIAGALAELEARQLRRVLAAMAVSFPRALEALILKGLSPLAAELLTAKFEEADALASEESENLPDGPGSLPVSQRSFYGSFYGVFEDPQVAMAAILDGKEAFAKEALDNVMGGILGLKCT